MLSACAHKDLHWQRSVANCNRVEAAVRAELDKHLLAAGLLFNAYRRIQSDTKSLLAMSCSSMHQPAIRPHTLLLNRATEPSLNERLSARLSENAITRPTRQTAACLQHTAAL